MAGPSLSCPICGAVMRMEKDKKDRSYLMCLLCGKMFLTAHGRRLLEEKAMRREKEEVGVGDLDWLKKPIKIEKSEVKGGDKVSELKEELKSIKEAIKGGDKVSELKEELKSIKEDIKTLKEELKKEEKREEETYYDWEKGYSL